MAIVAHKLYEVAEMFHLIKWDFCCPEDNALHTCYRNQACQFRLAVIAERANAVGEEA